MNGPVVYSSHRGFDVALGRPKRSPFHGGHDLVKAARLMDSLSSPPDQRDWLKAAELQAGGNSLGFMLNDRLGDCTIAAKGHIKQILTANTGTMVTPSDSLILADYERVDGYDPNDPNSDRGGIMADVNTAWMGPQGVAGLRMKKVIPIRYQVLEDVMKAVDRYGFADCGLAMPRTARDQSVWTLAAGRGADALPGSWGGHDAVIVAYNRATGLFTFETWGMRQDASADWLMAYMDEGYTGIPDDPALFLPNGYSAADLANDLSVLA